MKNFKIISFLALLTFLFSFNLKKENIAAIQEINSEITLYNNGDNLTENGNLTDNAKAVSQNEGNVTSVKEPNFNKEVIDLIVSKQLNIDNHNITRATITIANPVGGMEYCLFESQYIDWETSGAIVPNVSIFLMHPNGQSVQRTIASGISNEGRFLWDSGASNEGNYIIKISGMTNASLPSLITGETGEFTLKDCRKPDLQVGSIQIIPQNPGEGQKVTFKGNVMNYGENAVQNPVVRLEIERPAGLATRRFTEIMNVTLEKNQGVTFEKEFNVPKYGTYKTKFILDSNNLIDEMDELNNDKSWSFGVHALPDIIVCVSNGKRPPVGRKREIRMVVKNIGNGNTDAVSGIILRSYVEGKGVKIYDIPPLAPGDSHTVTRKHSWGTAGTKTIRAKIIYAKNEINSNNNEVQGSFFARLPHHDKYSTAPKVKCSTNETFYSWEEFEN